GRSGRLGMAPTSAGGACGNVLQAQAGVSTGAVFPSPSGANRPRDHPRFAGRNAPANGRPGVAYHQQAGRRRLGMGGRRPGRAELWDIYHVQTGEEVRKAPETGGRSAQSKRPGAVAGEWVSGCVPGTLTEDLLFRFSTRGDLRSGSRRGQETRAEREALAAQVGWLSD